MEILEKKYQTCVKALAALEASIDFYQKSAYDQALNLFIRDSMIKRFEYTSDIFWKYLYFYLKTKYGTQPSVVAPKSIYQESASAGIISESEASQLITMVNIRNSTVHTYDEPFAKKICASIPDCAHLMHTILQRLIP